MKKLVAIGEALIDMIPTIAGVELKDVPSFERTLGGAPTNVAGAYAMLGGHAQVMTMLGKDAFGDYILEQMYNKSIDTSLVKRTEKANTALAFVTLLPNGEREFSFYRNPSSDMLLSESDVNPLDLENAILHFCSVDLIEAPVKYAHIKAIKATKESDGIISFDPNLRFPLWKDKAELKSTVLEFCSFSDIIKVSDEELEFITGTANASAAAKFFMSFGAKLVFITMGKCGAMAYTNDFAILSHGKPCKATDTTGAGDIFIGTALFAMQKLNMELDSIKKEDLQIVLDCAVFASGLSVMQKGANFDVSTFIDKFDFLYF